VLELELKSVVHDVAACRARIEAAGGRVVEAGLMTDLRYDAASGTLAARDEVLRTRAIARPDGTVSGSLDWKGPGHVVEGYKAREEQNAAADAVAMATILARLGYAVTQRIDRDIVVYALDGATVRFERYARMDTLVEVEGEPASIERAIAVLGLPRDGFSTGRLREFAASYERRTGESAVTSAPPNGAPSNGATPNGATP
jgi:adenylate cyclase class IV